MNQVRLNGLAREWWQDAEVRGRLGRKDIGELVCTTNGLPIASKDADHCAMNRCIVGPLIQRMKACGCLKPPSKTAVEEQIKMLYSIVNEFHNVSEGTLFKVKIPDEVAARVYCVTTSIKNLVLFARGRFVRGHQPRDKGISKKRPKEISRPTDL